MKTRHLDLEPIHSFFELSYAEYLTIPRTVLQSMPTEWQTRFVQCLEEMENAIDWRPKKGCYYVRLLYDDQEGGIEDEYRTQSDFKELCDPLANYERGRRRLKMKATTSLPAREAADRKKT